MKKLTLAPLLFMLLLITGLVTGCGSSSDEKNALTIDAIPVYPNATSGESMGGSSMGGFVSGSLKQYTTTDDYDEVLSFYRNALTSYQTQTMSHTSELGRQAAISVPQDNGMVTVSIQEFASEGTVNITFMQVQQ